MSIRPQRISWRLLIAVGVLTAAGCDSEDANDAVEPLARPVSFVELELTNPRLETLLAGSVDSWKKELVGFRVDGRVNFVREPGVNVDGRVLAEDGQIVEDGTLVASIDRDQYLLRAREAQARVRSVEASARAVRIEVEKTIPNELKEVRAEYDRAQKEFDRQAKLLRSGNTPQRRVDEARAAFSAASARLAQIESRRSEKESELAAIEADITEAENIFRQARVDLTDTELYAPFKGQVSKVHVIPGGFVEQGQPVATVQMMDPMKVQVAVSAETDRSVNYNDLVKIYLDNESEPFNGWVWNKDAVADASTRTFMVTLLVRNRQIEVGVPPEFADKAAHRTSDILTLDSEFDDGRPPYFVDEQTLHQDNIGYFVWKVEGLSLPDLAKPFEPVFTVKKVRVRPGDRRLPYVQIFTYRELEDIGDLKPGLDLITTKLADTVQDGDSVLLSRKRWMLRPGEIVEVDLRGDQVPAGFYVPAQAIIKQDADHHVFVVSEQANGVERAAKVAVRLGDSIGTFQGIEPVVDGELNDGMKLIVDGAHYLRDGEAVRAVFEAEEAR